MINASVSAAVKYRQAIVGANLQLEVSAMFHEGLAGEVVIRVVAHLMPASNDT